MGLNFYLVYPEQVDVECHCCGHVKQEQKKLHLGKSSYGWVYSLRVYPEKGLRYFHDMEEYVTKVCGGGGWIEDEYGDVLEHHVEWFHIVKNRSHPISFEERLKACKNGYEYVSLETQPRGPNNLHRHHVDGKFCIGHGYGTWDYFAEDFS